MNKRLQQFLAAENISQAQFAETLGVARASVSHILSGRNKPSFEFLEKMMTAYPDINPEWLILGKGRPYKSGRPEPEPVEKTDLFTEMPESVTTAEPSLIPEQQHHEEEKMPEQRVENRIFDAFTAGAQAQSVKKIARIIVFFNDGTYEEK